MNMSSPENNRSVVKTVLAVVVAAIAALVVLVQRQSPIRQNESTIPSQPTGGDGTVSEVNAPRLEIVSGNDQHVIVNDVLPEPLAVRVLTSDGEPMVDTKVMFQFQGRSGIVKKEIVTDEAGYARSRMVPESFGHLEVDALLPGGGGGPEVKFRISVTGWVSTLAGDGIQGFGGDGGVAVDCQMNGPFGIVLDDKGDIIFVDWYSNRIRRIDESTGLISTIAGQGLFRMDGDGGAARKANMNGPYALKRDAAGNLFVSDYFSGRIRRIDVETGVITTVAGMGKHDNTGDGGPATEAGVDVPLDIAVDPNGNIFISDWHHNVIRRVDFANGRISTFAGVRNEKRGFNGDDRPAKSARLNRPLGLATDSEGNVYVADWANHRIRRVSSENGLITTIAGNGEKGFSGDGGLATEAQLRYPYNVTLDAAGNLYIADSENHRIRMVDVDTGIITTIAGNGKSGFSGDGGSAIEASFNGLFSLEVNRDGELLVADYFNNRLRKIGFTRPQPVRSESRDERLMRQARQLFGALPADAWSLGESRRQERVDLGRRLFHEKQLSRDGDVSCSSCHDLKKYGVDHRKIAIGHRKRSGNRNVPSVFNAALQEAQFWDGRAPTVEAQAAFPISNPLEMAMSNEGELVRRLGSSSEYPSLFRKAFPEEGKPISIRNVTRAIGAFERGLVTPGRFDDFIRGDAEALSTKEKGGLNLFLREGCAACHFGPLLGGVKLALRKPYPSSTYGFDYEFRKYFGDEFAFKVPQLRNIAETSPYLHDGSAETLEDAVAKRLKSYQYGESQAKIEVSLTEGEMEMLVEFMRSLTGTIDMNYIVSANP